MRLIHRHPRVTLLPFLALMVGMATAGSLSETASAASYVVRSCGSPAGSANHSWSLSNGAPASLTAGSGCGGTGPYGGLYVRGTPGGANLADGASGGWAFAAPSGLSISAITYSRWLWKQDDDDLQPELRTTEGTVLDGCSIAYPQSRCDVGVSGGAPRTLSGFSTTSLTMRLGCHLTSGFGCVADGGTVPGAATVLYDAAVTVRDDVAPSWSASPSGTIYADGWVRGRRSFTLSGSDASGIQRVFAQVDGADAGHADQDCDYTYARPCANVTGATATVETAALGDGTHALRAGLRDAAGNESLSDPVTIKVDNTAPGSPSLVSPPRAWSADPTPTIGLGVPPAQASPVSEARYTICDALGVNCGTPQGVEGPPSAGGFFIEPAVPEGQHVLRAWFADQAGNSNPTSAVKVDVGVDTTAPAEPLDVSEHEAGESDGYLSWTLPSDAGSPITGAYVQVCAVTGGCNPPSPVPSIAAALPDLEPGRYTARVWLVDDVGNSDPGRSTTLTFTVPRPALATSTTTTWTLPPAPPPTTDATPATTQPNANPTIVRAASAISVGARVRAPRHVTVTAVANAPGPLRVTIGVQDAKGHPLRSIKRTVVLHRGRATIAFVATKAARRIAVRASFAGSSTWLPGSAASSFRLPRS